MKPLSKCHRSPFFEMVVECQIGTKMDGWLYQIPVKEWAQTKNAAYAFGQVWWYRIQYHHSFWLLGMSTVSLSDYLTSRTKALTKTALESVVKLVCHWLIVDHIYRSSNQVVFYVDWFVHHEFLMKSNAKNKFSLLRGYCKFWRKLNDYHDTLRNLNKHVLRWRFYVRVRWFTTPENYWKYWGEIGI